MFGYLPAPCRCRIGDQVDLYRSTFCGLCNALARQYGQPARLLVNRDSTFVALLAAAQTPEAPAATLSTRCQPWRRPLPVFESGPIPAFAGAVTLCGLWAKLDDEHADERGLRAAGCRLLSALSRARFDRAQAVLAAGDFPVVEVWRRLKEQADVEAQAARGGDPAEAMQPSARAFGSILAHTARLADTDANVAPLYRVGQRLGELIYTLDAYEDLDDDRRRGRFNFLASQVGTWGADSLGEVRRLAREIASECQRQIRQAWQEVELPRYRPVLEAVLLTGLSARTERVLAADAIHPLSRHGGNLLMSRKKDAIAPDASCWNGCQNCYCPGGECGECCNCCGPNGCCDCGACGCGGCENCDCSGCDCGGCDNCDCSGCDCSGCDCSS